MVVCERTGDIIKLPTFEIFKIRLFSLFWGFWSLLKFSFKKLFTSSEKEYAVIGNPPSCLTDSSLGHHSYIKIKGVKFHYVEAGIKEQPLVILLHGFPDFWITWRNQIPELSKHYRVVAVDLKGFGDSDKPESRSNYGIKRIIDEINELIVFLGYKKCTLIGHDLGGFIGWLMVHLHPEIVHKFVAISAPHPNLYWSSFSNSSPFNVRWLQFCQLPSLPEMETLDNDLTVINNVYGHLNNTVENKSFLNAYKYAFSRKEDWTGAINYFRTLSLWRVQAAEGSIDVSTLLIVGNQEPREFFECVIRSTDYIEKYTLKVVENASRYVHQEKPQEVNKILINFLRGNQISVPTAKPPSNGLVNRVFGAVSNTLNYGNGVFGAVKKVNQTGLRALTTHGNTS
ncbi:epoxide hydrolase 4 [Halyomorpha halys]|uniref:epoxide hydrolase 4 n=1 Tax=Halyomorpha halys TaxID=286706 RepID=UPI0006D51F4D|nr:epoxide hydrolase 4-like [Halyomorpha halys]